MITSQQAKQLKAGDIIWIASIKNGVQQGTVTSVGRHYIYYNRKDGRSCKTFIGFELSLGFLQEDEAAAFLVALRLGLNRSLASINEWKRKRGLLRW